MSFKRMRGRRQGDSAAVSRCPAYTNLLLSPRIHIKTPRPEAAQIIAEGSFVGGEQPAACSFLPSEDAADRIVLVDE